MGRPPARRRNPTPVSLFTRARAAAIACLSALVLSPFVFAGSASAAGPIPFDVAIRLANTAVNATMVPWSGSTAPGAVVRVWPAKYTGDVWSYHPFPGSHTAGWLVNDNSGLCLAAQDPTADSPLRLEDCHESATEAFVALPRPNGFTIRLLNRPDLAIGLKTPSWSGSNLTLRNSYPGAPVVPNELVWTIRAA